MKPTWRIILAKLHLKISGIESSWRDKNDSSVNNRKH